QLLLEFLAFVHDELAIFAYLQGPAFERARGWSFEVHAADLEAAAVAGALELLRVFKPVRRTAKVGAGGAQGIDDVALLFVLVADDPGALVLEALDDFLGFKLAGRADLELARRLGKHIGKQKANGAQQSTDAGGGEGGPGDAEPGAKGGGEETTPRFADCRLG